MRASDPLIVLGDGRAVHRGKGRTGIRSLHRKHGPDMKDRTHNANLPAGNSEEGASQKGYRFRNLYGMLNEEFLQQCWRDIRKNAAAGWIRSVPRTTSSTWTRTSRTSWSV